MKPLMSHFAGLNRTTLRLAGVLLLAGAGLTGCATGYLLDREDHQPPRHERVDRVILGQRLLDP